VKVAVFAPEAMFTEVPTMISPENDNGIFGDIKSLEFFKQTSNLCIRITHARVVAVNQLPSQFVGQRAILGDAMVGAQLAPRTIASRCVAQAGGTSST